jgi:UDP-N-acetylmuramyl pentapeptide phosphotransferase/UDP-N-acetylglucosamine-1-phosphate transferase
MIMCAVGLMPIVALVFIGRGGSLFLSFAAAFVSIASAIGAGLLCFQERRAISIYFGECSQTLSIERRRGCACRRNDRWIRQTGSRLEHSCRGDGYPVGGRERSER